MKRGSHRYFFLNIVCFYNFPTPAPPLKDQTLGSRLDQCRVGAWATTASSPRAVHPEVIRPDLGARELQMGTHVLPHASEVMCVEPHWTHLLIRIRFNEGRSPLE